MKTILQALCALILTSSCAHQESQPLALSGYEGKPRVLILLSASNHVTTREATQHQTGYFLSELARPSIALEHAGFAVEFATPGGEPPSMDPSSNDPKWFKTPQDLSDALTFVQNHRGLNRPKPIETLTVGDLSQFIGIFVPGGHAPIEDLAHNPDVGRILAYFHAEMKPTALICHGPAALLSAKSKTGWLYRDYKMTGFSTVEEKQEEDAGHLDGHMPFYLDEALRTNGGDVSVGAPWTSSVVKDRELITGQNPMSEEEFTSVLLETLTKARLSGHTPTFVSNLQTMANGQHYSISERSIEVGNWDNGHRTVWIGYRNDAPNFWNHLRSHIGLTLNTFQNEGLEGYVVFPTADYEVAYMRWTNKEAADRAFSSAAGQAVVTDASSFMKALLFKEISENPFRQ